MKLRFLALSLLVSFPSAGAFAGTRYILVCGSETPDCAKTRLPAGSRVIKTLDAIRTIIFEADDPAVSIFSRGLAPGEAIYEDKVIQLPDDRKPPRALLEDQSAPVPPGEPELQPESEIQWGIQRIHAPETWTRMAGAGAVVAILDTGVDLGHPDLKDNIVGSYNMINPELSAQDDNGHGTHVAGIVAALHNGSGVAGVAPEAGLLAVKVMDSSGRGTLSDMASGIIWAVDHGANIINLSMETYQPPKIIKAATDYAALKRVLVVAAAGNNASQVAYPAAYDSVVAVLAINKDDGAASWTNYGPEIDFVAPGVQIKSLEPGAGTSDFGGTSAAAPHISGLAALAYSAGFRDAVSMRTALEKAAARLGLIMPEYQGAGLIDARKIAYP